MQSGAAELRAASPPARRSIKKQWQAAWLVNAIRCIDLTTLSGDDTAERVRRLCAKARNPVAPAILEALGLADAVFGFRQRFLRGRPPPLPVP